MHASKIPTPYRLMVETYEDIDFDSMFSQFFFLIQHPLKLFARQLEKSIYFFLGSVKIFDTENELGCL